MAVTVSNTTLTAFNTKVELVDNAATSSVIDATEVFTITPSKADYKTVIRIKNGTGQGALAWSFAAGTFWAGGSALTGSVADGKTDVIVLEGAKYQAQAGTISLTLTPASGKRLLTDHAAAVAVIQLP
jgi:hypothetical protein